MNDDEKQAVDIPVERNYHSKKERRQRIILKWRKKLKIMKEKTIEELEQELKEMKDSHRSLWDTYGSELCAGDMIRQEEKLENDIARLKEREALKQRTINQWKKSKILDGLIPMKDKPWLFESDPNQKIKE